MSVKTLRVHARSALRTEPYLRTNNCKNKYCIISLVLSKNFVNDVLCISWRI